MTEIVQGTPEWFAARLGKITASQIDNVLMAPDKAGYRNYRAALVCERLTGEAEETFCSFDMQRGTELEPIARECYEFVTGREVKQIGFAPHPYIAMGGCSPDGLVGDDGLIEIKAPKAATHLDYILGGVVPKDYVKQITWQLACTGRQWCDFVSYCPKLPEQLQLFIVRMPRDAAAIEAQEKAAFAFDKAVDAMIAELGKVVQK